MRERLQKVIAAAGVTSRRKAEQMIEEARVTVNGRTITELGTRVEPGKDHVRVDGQLIRPEPLEYYVVNKPQGVLSSASDPLKRPLVTDLIKRSRRLYPAGRLDFQSEGLIILTNDGELARKVMRSGEIEKVYRVKVLGQASEDKLAWLRSGIKIGDQKFFGCKIALLKEARNCWYEVILRQGKNRQIRRMFERIGHPVMRIRRTAIGPVALGNLPPGHYRKMTPEEVRMLKRNQKRQGVEAR